MSEQVSKKTKKTTIDSEEIYKSPLYEKNKDDFISKSQKSLANKYYFKHQFKKDLLLIILSAFLTMIAFDYFVSPTGGQGVYPGGLGSIAKFIAVKTNPGTSAEIIAKQGTYYYIWYLVINIPFIAFGLWKLGLRFTLLTLLYILLQIAFDQIVSHIPVINPQSWHMIIDYPLISKFGSVWNSVIWLFVFAFIGGALVGYAYSWVYRANGSAGGTDFVTMYVSQKKNKNIGSVNAYANYIILALIIILNTALMGVNEISAQTKVSVLNQASDSELTDFAKWIYTNQSDLTWFQELQHSFNVQSTANKIALNGSTDADRFADAMVNHKMEFEKTYQLMITSLADESLFDVKYTKGMINKMRFYYVFGPSLFASIVYVIISSITTNAGYPKFKVRTYVISTEQPDAIIKVLQDNGYRNEITIEKPDEILVKGIQSTDKRIMTLSMTVINWKNIKQFIFEQDENMHVKVIATKKIEGKFDYEFSNDHTQNYFHSQIVNDPRQMKKIERASFQKTKSEIIENSQKEARRKKAAAKKAKEHDAKVKNRHQRWPYTMFDKIKNFFKKKSK